MEVLRDHGSGAAVNPSWRPDGITNLTVCCHASWGPIRFSGTTGSLIFHLAPDLQTHWVTGASAPCTGIFKPVYLEAGLPDLGPEPTDAYDPSSLWWNHERLHRAVLEDYPTRPRVSMPDSHKEQQPGESPATAGLSSPSSSHWG